MSSLQAHPSVRRRVTSELRGLRLPAPRSRAGKSSFTCLTTCEEISSICRLAVVAEKTLLTFRPAEPFRDLADLSTRSASRNRSDLSTRYDPAFYRVRQRSFPKLVFSTARWAFRTTHGPLARPAFVTFLHRPPVAYPALADPAFAFSSTSPIHAHVLAQAPERTCTSSCPRIRTKRALLCSRSPTPFGVRARDHSPARGTQPSLPVRTSFDAAAAPIVARETSPSFLRASSTFRSTISQPRARCSQGSPLFTAANLRDTRLLAVVPRWSNPRAW
jgi:hypothetical protein